MPLVDAELVPSPESAALKQTAGDALEPVVVSSPLTIEELERSNKKLELRVKDLETALAESRKIIRDREQLLTQLQWKPKVRTFFISYLFLIHISHFSLHK
jgi:hypothetical protein